MAIIESIERFVFSNSAQLFLPGLAARIKALHGNGAAISGLDQLCAVGQPGRPG